MPLTNALTPTKTVEMIAYRVEVPYEENGKLLKMGGEVRVWKDSAQIIRGNDALDSKLSLTKIEKVADLFTIAAALIKNFPKDADNL